MLIKWIVCTVPPQLRTEFFQAQKQWSELRSVPGFVAQVGGWNLKDLSESCILAVWETLAAYRNFMDTIHDNVVSRSAQHKSYTSISVVLYENLMDIPGCMTSFTSAIRKGKLLRVADCILKPNRDQYLLEVQRNFWNPGMKQSNGMLAGLFGQGLRENHRYLVATLWKDSAVHQVYVEQQLPALRVQAHIENDLERLTGRVIQLEDEWCVS